MTLLELAAVIGLFAVVVGMAIGFSQSWRQAWHAERLAVRLTAAANQAHEALALFYVGEYCVDRIPARSYDESAGLSFTAAEFYSDVLQRHVDEAAWARLLRDLPGGDAPRDFFTGWIWRVDRIHGALLLRSGFTSPPSLEVRWSGYDPDEFGVPGEAMATRAGAVWDDGTDEIIWQRNLDRRSTRRQTRLRTFLVENSTLGPGNIFSPDRCFY